MSVIPITLTYSSALVNYSNIVNQILSNEYAVKSNNRRIKTTASRGGRVVRGSRGHQGPVGRGVRGGRGRGTASINNDWEVAGMNGRTIRVHPDNRFENDQWFNIPEVTRLQITQMQRCYQSRKRQRTNAGSGTNSQYQHQRKFQ